MIPMKIACACLLLIFISPKPGICQAPNQVQQDMTTTIVRMQDRLDRDDAEIQKLRDRMTQVSDKATATEMQSQDNTKDIGILKYLGGGLVFIAGVFVAELVRRVATRVQFQAKPSS
jgi:hypothetical protein